MASLTTESAGFTQQPDDQQIMQSLKTSLNAFFLVTMGAIVFFMQCGFAFLEAGSVRSKNTTNILIKNLLDSCIAAISYWLVGWPLAYGEPGNFFVGHADWLAIGMSPKKYSMLGEWFFQFVFAATASTIVSGALAERCEFIAYFVYSAALTAFTYPIVTHWAWDPQGWLANGPSGVKYMDFAGSGVVHLHGGTVAFVGALILGPRIGRYDEGHSMVIKGHSVPFAALGGFVLMFGFFAFNGGSQLSITEERDGEIVALAMFNTILAGSAAALTTLLANKLFLGGKAREQRKWSLLLTINAMLAGMVSSCASCNVIYPWAAVVIGIGAGLMYLGISYLVDLMKVDDPLDAVAVHFGGGLWGVVMTPIFMHDKGVIYAADELSGIYFGWNLVGAAAIIAWSIVTMGPIFYLLRLVKILRVPEEIERKGLDIWKHGEPAYPLIAYGHGWVDESSKDIQSLPLRERANLIANRMSVGMVPTPSSPGCPWPPMSRVFESAELQAAEARECHVPVFINSTHHLNMYTPMSDTMNTSGVSMPQLRVQNPNNPNPGNNNNINNNKNSHYLNLNSTTNDQTMNEHDWTLSKSPRTMMKEITTAI